jgi:hypothetical protein
LGSAASEANGAVAKNAADRLDRLLAACRHYGVRCLVVEQELTGDSFERTGFN